ncbi:MAG: response regulator [Dehalococcoidales bacterium]|jgi:DNA-binding response OmpR family regulator
MVKKHGTLTILIIEDDPDIQNFTARVLELEGYHVIKASDGRAGLQIVRDNPISLVLLDLRLPELDGWAVLREMKQDAELARIPVLVLTAIAEPTQRRRTMNMGAAQYLVKPLSVNSLSKIIAGILNQKSTAAHPPSYDKVVNTKL